MMTGINATTPMMSIKAEWMKSTGELLAEFEGQVALRRRYGGTVPTRQLKVIAEIRSAMAERSNWTDEEFEAWMDSPMPGEMLDS
jgi:hypothetical protein